MDLSNQEEVTKGQVRAKPWLAINEQTDTLLLSYANQYRDRLFMAPTLIRSINAGLNWSPNVAVNQAVSIADINMRGATWPDDIQTLQGSGDNLALVWTWTPTWQAWPRSIWLSTSSDGGDTLSEIVQIGETWGPITADSRDGQYYILYQTGTEEAQSIALAHSADEGKRWRSTIISNPIPLRFDASKAPGLSISGDGVIDVIFYAPNDVTSGCGLNPDAWATIHRAGWVDQCDYDLYYTYSRDNGLAFSQPIPLNDTVIEGPYFVQQNGVTQIGPHLAVAGTDTNAYALWINATQHN